MDDPIWNLFRDTGEPMGYLLLCAEEKIRRTQKPPAAEVRNPSRPPEESAASD